VNPYDEWYSLVRALELKEAAGSGEVTIITVGGADVEPIMRKALAIGADKAVRIDQEPEDAFLVAYQIAEYAKDKNFDLVIFGKETIDHNGSQLGAMVAEMLDMPYLPLCSKLEVSGNTATVERDVKGGVEVCDISTPFVLSASKGMAEQRIPNMRGIMAARSKPLEVITPAAGEAKTTTAKFALPPAKSGVKLIDAENAAELIELLHNEAKVI
jgi:electron transfer flavoprotein beta subunit